MNMNRMSFYKNRKAGFTIVELLIVIVIIAILAAVTIVAYNGIQQRAENTKTTSAVNAYAKAMNIYAAQFGAYPIDPAYPCLNDSDTYCGSRTTGGNCLGAGAAARVTTFDNELKKVMSSLPQASDQEITCGSTKMQGGLIRSTDGKSAFILFFLRGNVDCVNVPSASVTKTQQDDATRCTAYLPTL